MKQSYILGMIVVILLLLWLGSDILKVAVGSFSKAEIEGFATRNVSLNFCPTWAPQVQTAKGNTDCCEGDMVDGKCNGKTFCSLSPPHDGIPSCLDAWKRYYEQKSIQQCPQTMPNYFEDQKNKQAPVGCSASLIEENGSKPKNAASARCRIYKTERENREMRDSCFVEKGRLAVRCPVYTGYTSKVELVNQGDKFGSYVCSYVNPLGQRNSCNDEKSLLAMWDRTSPNWRMDTTKYTQLENLSCRTFIERERQKEMERQRIEAARRQAEQERQRREAMANRFRGFFNRFKQQSQSALNRLRQTAQREKDAAARRVRELQSRLRVCK